VTQDCENAPKEKAKTTTAPSTQTAPQQGTPTQPAN
jgi:hypothetical protein